MSESYVTLRAELLRRVLGIAFSTYNLNNYHQRDCIEAFPGQTWEQFDEEFAFVKAAIDLLACRLPIEIVYDRPAVESETV